MLKVKRNGIRSRGDTGNSRALFYLLKLFFKSQWPLDRYKEIILICIYYQLRASLEAQMVKNLPTMEESQAQSLGWEDPLEEGTATHSSILAWRIPWTGAPGGLQSPGLQRVGHD